MPVTIKHRFVSAKADLGDATLLRPSNWNDSLVVAGGADGEFLIIRTAVADGYDASGAWAGPFGLGQAKDARNQLTVGGAYTPTGASPSAALALVSALSPPVGNSAALLRVAGTLNEAASGAHADMVGALFETPTIVGGAASVTAASTVKITGAPTAGTTNYALWVAAGNVRFDGTLVQFAGTTASFPALKRSTTDLQVRLANDSGYTGMSALTLKSLGANGEAASNGHGVFVNDVSIASEAALIKMISRNAVRGMAWYRNTAAAGDFSTNDFIMGWNDSTGILQIKGTTSSFPGLKRSSAALHARLADDSAFADFSAAKGLFSAAFAGGRVTPTYGASVAINAALGLIYEIVATNGTAFTVANPTNPQQGGQPIAVKIKNTSGGALGAVTWDTLYKLATWTSPANGFSRTIWFVYDGTNWVDAGRTTVDVPN